MKGCGNSKKPPPTSFQELSQGSGKPIESFFNWLNDGFGIQNASKVRPNQGLIVHTFGKIAAALALWIFNP